MGEAGLHRRSSSLWWPERTSQMTMPTNHRNSSAHTSRTWKPRYALRWAALKRNPLTPPGSLFSNSSMCTYQSTCVQIIVQAGV
eukprot:1286355-Amphidinium_carterae.1